MHPVLARRALVAYNGYNTGLGNRLRVVLSCQSLAELENREFSYVWPTGKLFGPKFSELFDFRGRVVSRSTSRLLAKVYPYLNADLDWLADPKIQSRRIWQIRSGSEVKLPDDAVPWPEKLRALHPNPGITARVEQAFQNRFADRGYIGVSVRVHSVSHQVTKDVSPVEWFLEELSQIRATAPNTPIFISCDVPEVQQRIEQSIEGAWGFKDKGDYNSKAGIESAICDLYLLASSGFILGPHFSSFVHLAQHLAGGLVKMKTSQSPTTAQQPDLQALSMVNDPLRPAIRKT
jgi:hypothetical protein